MRVRSVILLAVFMVTSSFALDSFAADEFVSVRSAEIVKELNPVEEEAFFKAMDSHIATVTGLKANFVQVRYVAFFSDLLSSRGRLFYEKPDRLRWEMHEPYASIMIFNGGLFAKYNRENGKYVRMKSGMEKLMRESLSQIITMMNADFTRMKKDYDISVRQQEKYIVTLVPLSTAMRRIIDSIVIDLDPIVYRVEKVKILEAQGDSIEIRFSDSDENVQLEESFFDVNEPDLGTE